MNIDIYQESALLNIEAGKRCFRKKTSDLVDKKGFTFLRIEPLNTHCVHCALV